MSAAGTAPHLISNPAKFSPLYRELSPRPERSEVKRSAVSHPANAIYQSGRRGAEARAYSSFTGCAISKLQISPLRFAPVEMTILNRRGGGWKLGQVKDEGQAPEQWTAWERLVRGGLPKYDPVNHLSRGVISAGEIRSFSSGHCHLPKRRPGFKARAYSSLSRDAQ